jgi:catechol 2,3-dioxygenase-like lactoylglutathione lyase family enzyme
MRTLLVILLAACAAEPRATGEALDPIEARNPLDLRRTTLIVSDMERSLAFYEGALGMEVRYDEELTSPGLTAKVDADGMNRSRLVLLKTNDDFVAGLGLWQFLDRPSSDGPVEQGGFETGDIILLFNTDELDAQFAAAAAVPGAVVVDEPHLREYPSGDGVIRVRVSMLLDPDGYVVELNQLLDR